MATVIKAGNVASGAQVTPDATGILQFNTGSGAGTAAMTLGTDQSVAFAGNLSVDGNTTLGNANTDTILMTAAPSIGGAGLGMGFGFRNRIINGAMVIDQRNAGAAVTVNAANSFYCVDRWFGYGQLADGVFTLQRITDAPSGFTNSMRATVTTADASIGASQLYLIQHRIEGFNVADFGFGTAVAVPVTLSFWVKSSVTGTFSGSLGNTVDLSYAFSYTISSANTWTQISVTVPGPTTGTWTTGNGIGLSVTFSLGVGSSLKGTANTWANYPYATTGSVDLISTLNATWQVTGVQLEKGSTATSFDYRDYGTELVRCQRYYWKLFPNDANRLFGAGQCFTTTAAGVQIPFEVQMRTRPTALEQSTTASHYKILNSAGGDVVCSAVPTHNAVTTDYMAWVTLTVASGIVAGNGTTCLTNNAAAYLAWSAEL